MLGNNNHTLELFMEQSVMAFMNNEILFFQFSTIYLYVLSTPNSSLPIQIPYFASNGSNTRLFSS